MGARREPRQLRHEHHKVPVTALDICSDDVVLAGEGVKLVAYNVDKKVQLDHVQVFRSQAIHRILSNGQEIVVCGGSLIAYVRLHRNSDGTVELQFLGTLKDTGDWILDAAFAPATGECQPCVALITAHNSLIKCSLNFPQGEIADTVRIHTETVVPGSNCILYCAHITWLSDSLCLIASGTAFGDIILWSSPFSLMDSKELKATTHYVFPAHEGSVFGTQISLPLSEDILGGPCRVLASCSDDRTVRLWDISDLSCESPSMTDIQRETGFGSTVQSNAHAPPLLAKAMGHISRIWSVRFISKNRIHSENSPETSQLAIVSFGEDASRITWDVKKTTSENGGPRYELEQSQIHSLHTGKNIWSQALREDRCVTGGADGSIALLPSAGIRENIVEIGNVLLSLPPNETCGSLNDVFKSYAFVGKDTLVATTAQGRIVALTLNEDGPTTIEPHGGYESLKSFSMVTSAFGVAFIAGICGFVHIWPLRTRRCATVAALPGKVAGIFLSQPLGATEPSVEAVPPVLVTTVGGKAAYLTHICPTVEADGLESYRTEQQILELEPGFIVTSFLLVSLCNVDFAVLGSRNGSLAIYRLSSTAEKQPIAPPQILDKCHGKDAVTALKWSTTIGQEGKGYLYSTGRDGTYTVRRVTFQQSELLFELVHQLELPFGPNIEGLDLTDDGHVRLWGFRSKKFVVHDATSHQDIMTVTCGGVHRNWAYEPSANGGTFAWTKASTLMRATQSKVPHHSLHAGGHGREIKATAVSPGTHQIIATGAEDTDIKLFVYSQAGFECLQTLRKHNTGIQHLQWSRKGNYLFSSAGFEEFHVWRVCHDVPFVNVGVVCESAHPRSGSSDLRIVGFEANEQPVDEHGSAAFEIVMVYSDSSIKRWHYGNETWTLQDSGDYLTACLTDALTLPTSDGSRSGGRLMTTATDGHIALWASQTGGNLVWEQRQKVHQNAILTSSAHALSDGSFFLVTAGDDNGLGITRVNVEGQVSTLLIPRAHAAAVTALAVHPVDEDQFNILTASIDQRVKLWNLGADVRAKGVDSIQVSKAQTAFTSVADVSSMSLLRLENGCMGVVICGVGMDVWRLEGSMST